MARKPDVRARMNYLRGLVNKGTEKLFSITKAEAAALVLEDAVQVIRGDPSDLITHRRLNCRHCHGTNHAFRWRDDEEFWSASADAAEAQAQWDETPEDRRRGKRPKLPTDEGGYGFRNIAPPMPGCPKCEGEGIADVRVADVRTLSGPARTLYNGVKVKKDGSIEVLMRSKDAARDLLGKFAGVVVDQVKHSGVVGLTPIPLSDEVRAAVLKAIENDI
jgi:phage terminase small subunit